jgi:plasmid stabilization system protein ParE
MVKKEIVWTKIAQTQRRAILAFWNEKNGNTTYAQKLIIEIRERLETLCIHPNSGKKTLFKNTRVAAMGHYSIFYQVHQRKLIITGFWDNRQNPKSLLKFFITT